MGAPTARTSTAIRHTAWNVATNSIGSPHLKANLRHRVRSRATRPYDLGHSAVGWGAIDVLDMVVQGCTRTVRAVRRTPHCPSFRQSTMRNCRPQGDLLAWP